MAANTTVFTYNAATGSSAMMKWTDTASNTGTGPLALFATASGSSAIPWEAVNGAGVGWEIDPTTGALKGVGTSSTHGFICPEGTPIAGSSTNDVFTCDNSTHRFLENPNNAGAIILAGIAAAGTAGDPVVLATNGIDIADGGSPAFATLTDASTVTWAIASRLVANANLTFTTHGGSRTLNLTGLVNGGSYVLWIKQDGTGGEGLTLGTGCTWKVSNGGGGAIHPSTGANVTDVLAFTYDGTNCYLNFNLNFN
jgi:hypothetical protein